MYVLHHDGLVLHFSSLATRPSLLDSSLCIRKKFINIIAHMMKMGNLPVFSVSQFFYVILP